MSPSLPDLWNFPPLQKNIVSSAPNEIDHLIKHFDNRLVARWVAAYFIFPSKSLVTQDDFAMLK